MSNNRFSRVFKRSLLLAGCFIALASGCSSTSRDYDLPAPVDFEAMQTPFQHVVHFWLREDLTDEQRASFLEGVRSLGNSPNVAGMRVAVPAGTPREIVDNSYDVQLTVWFDSSEAHDAYQSPSDAAHVAFGKAFKPFWTRVLIYDSLAR